MYKRQQLAASIRFSGTASSRPAGAMIFWKASSSSAVTLLEQYWIMPSPTEAGVLGMKMCIRDRLRVADSFETE